MALVAFVLLPWDLGAQESAPLRKVTLSGQVQSTEYARPIPFATVLAAGVDTIGTPTGQDGAFSLRVAALDTVSVTVEALGFVPLTTTLSGTELDQALILRLEPDPVLLEGLSVTVAHSGVERTMELQMRRRNAYAGASRQIPRWRFMNDRTDAYELVRSLIPGVGPCPTSVPTADECVNRRGEMVPMRVCIDDALAVDGFSQLQSYRPWELQKVEFFSGSIMVVLAYTQRYMEKAVRGPLIVSPTPDTAC